MLYPYRGILFSHRKEEKSAMCNTWVKLEDIILSKINQRKTNTAWCHLYVESGGQVAESGNRE